jgi:hypothetical protein
MWERQSNGDMHDISMYIYSQVGGVIWICISASMQELIKSINWIPINMLDLRMDMIDMERWTTATYL